MSSLPKPATAGSIQLDRFLKILIIVSKQRIILLLLDQVELFKTSVFLNAATSNSTAALNSSVLLIDVFVNFRFLSHAFTSCSFSRNLSTFIITKKNMNYNTALVFPDTAKMFRNIPCMACTSLRISPRTIVFTRSLIFVTASNIQRGQ